MNPFDGTDPHVDSGVRDQAGSKHNWDWDQQDGIGECMGCHQPLEMCECPKVLALLERLTPPFSKVQLVALSQERTEDGGWHVARLTGEVVKWGDGPTLLAALQDLDTHTPVV